MEVNGQPTVALLLDELVGAAIPDLDRARAVVPLRDLALEAGVVERVILDVDGEMLRSRLERDALRNRPARQRPVALEPEVVVEASRIMALDDEDRLLRIVARRPRFLSGERLGSGVRIAFPAVLTEWRHARFLPFANEVSAARGLGDADLTRGSVEVGDCRPQRILEPFRSAHCCI